MIQAPCNARWAASGDPAVSTPRRPAGREPRQERRTISHLVGFLQVLGPRALARRELAVAIRAKATVAVFGPVELGQEYTGLAVEKPGRPLVLEHSGRLE